MVIYPVIMCGGAGTRLWPASRPSRPKQFIPLAGNRSLFQEAILRSAPLTRDAGRLIVVGGLTHRDLVLDQLEELAMEADILLEPEPRDSAPAMAAAAAFVRRRDPSGIVAFVASDHHIPDHEAFRAAIGEAAREADRGRIVTLGVRPTSPSSSYGYIKPRGRGLSEVETFVEKPDAERAADYIARGYLWNSGNFIASAQTLGEALKLHAPAVEAAAVEALGPGDGQIRLLSDTFRDAPRVSIDYAVMEKTRLASVLEVDFAWSDLGTWEAIAASGEGSVGLNVLEDAEGCVTRAPDGVLVAAMGVRNLAIIVEPDAILVSDLTNSANLKRLVERVRLKAPGHLDFPRPPERSLESAADSFARWMRLRALPFWATVGMTHEGAFAETVSLQGVPLTSFRRARVQARQIFVYATAGLLGWRGPWRAVVERALIEMDTAFRRPDGLYRARVSEEGTPLDETAMLYDQAFVMLAMATAREAGAAPDLVEQKAVIVRDALIANTLANGAFKETGENPYQANAHMHLFEAFLAWEMVGQDGGWARAADSIAGLALDVFVDPKLGCLREFYDEKWQPAQGEDGRMVEPGHQFEWASLLIQYGVRRETAGPIDAARRLYEFGRRGVTERGSFVIDCLNDDGSIRTRRARLWPQSEWLRAALLLAEHTRHADRLALLDDAKAAQLSLLAYLTADGLWHDKQLAPGSFLDEPAPASSFYHIMSAYRQLAASRHTQGMEKLAGLRLG